MEDFVTYDLAVKLKEKGFKEKCVAYYWEKINEHTPSFVVEDNIPDDGICIIDLLSEHNKAEWSPFIDAPTICQALKWLRETKNIEVVASFSYKNKVWGYQVGDMTLLEDSILSYDYSFPTYEEAALAGIEYVLDNLM